MKILTADDEPTSRLITETAIRSLGHECRVVTDGAEAWASISSARPDVVISDSGMPGLSGLELCRNIRAETTGRYIYFIMLTAHAALTDVLEGMNAGVDDYLVKPLDIDDLKARLIAAARVTSLHRQLAEQRIQLEQLNTELAGIARRDHLTELSNRRGLQEDLARLEARVVRYGHAYCLVLIDVDHFKSYNDGHGHLAGDEALRAVSAELNSQMRRGDNLYRYGGDEFLCVLPEQSLEAGETAVERMRAGVEGLAIPHAENRLGILTVSTGVAVLGSHHQSVNEVLNDADEALYRAKRELRDRSAQPVGNPA